MSTTIRLAEARDAAALAAVAAVTFPLACPPGTTEEAIATFIANTLSERSFARYLAEPDHILLLAEVRPSTGSRQRGGAAGYSMLIAGEPKDPDVAAVIAARPTIELSKMYVMPDQHGSGLAAALMAASVDAGREAGAATMWLGVNTQNARANRFYEKSGFRIVGHKKFRLGDVDEDDFVRERALPPGGQPHDG